MRPASAPPSPSRVSPESWRERSGRLFGEFERAAKAMVRRGFGGAFSNEEIEDIYASAWVGTLRSLANRHKKLTDAEIRSYVLTAVANQASKELRRRRRKPTAPLELVGSVADPVDTPEERAQGAESSRVTRDLLSSLPPRRRAVMLLRYGWGLEPSQVCGLVRGLSARSYRKEITRGVDEVTEKMRALEAGEWCSQREPILKAYVAGVADDDESRQARAHLSHCRDCAEFVGRLRGHLHDLGAGLALPAAVDGLDGHVALADRLQEASERVRDVGSGLIARGAPPVDEGAGHVIAAGGARGAGAAGAGVVAKLAGLGTVGKLAVACLGGGAAATACIAAGVAPFTPSTGSERTSSERRAAAPEVVATPAPVSLPSQLAADSAPVPPPVGATADSTPTANQQESGSDEPPSGAPTDPIDPETPPTEQEFGVAPAVTQTAPAAAPASTAGAGAGDQAAEEFAP